MPSDPGDDPVAVADTDALIDLVTETLGAGTRALATLLALQRAGEHVTVFYVEMCARCGVLGGHEPGCPAEDGSSPERGGP